MWCIARVQAKTLMLSSLFTGILGIAGFYALKTAGFFTLDHAELPSAAEAARMIRSPRVGSHRDSHVFALMCHAVSTACTLLHSLAVTSPTTQGPCLIHNWYSSFDLCQQLVKASSFKTLCATYLCRLCAGLYQGIFGQRKGAGGTKDSMMEADLK